MNVIGARGLDGQPLEPGRPAHLWPIFRCTCCGLKATTYHPAATLAVSMIRPTLDRDLQRPHQCNEVELGWWEPVGWSLVEMSRVLVAVPYAPGDERGIAQVTAALPREEAAAYYPPVAPEAPPDAPAEDAA